MDRKSIYRMVALGLLVVLLAAFSEHSDKKVNGKGQIIRNDPTDGSTIVDLQLSAEDVLKDYAYSLKVPARKWSEKEARELLQKAKEEIDQTFCTEGETVDHVTVPVSMRETYVDGCVKAEWMLNSYQVVDFGGTIEESKTSEEGTMIQATVDLTCGNYKECYTFSFVVYPKEKTKEEMLLAEIDKVLQREEELEGTKYLTLPQNVQGQMLVWNQGREHLAIKVLFFEILIGILLFFVKAERTREEEKKRREEMELDYAEVVNKLLILLGSGMSLKQAWNRISARYSDKRKNNELDKRWIYEEMLLTSHEISDGESERIAYQKFGERTGVGAYHRLVRILIQNLQTGSRGLCQLLERESETALEERKTLAKKLGEEAGTKMLLPLVMMLGIVIAIIMVPAVLSFNV